MKRMVYLSDKLLLELLVFPIEELDLDLASHRLLDQPLAEFLIRVGDIAGTLRIIPEISSFTVFIQINKYHMVHNLNFLLAL